MPAPKKPALKVPSHIVKPGSKLPSGKNRPATGGSAKGKQISGNGKDKAEISAKRKAGGKQQMPSKSNLDKSKSGTDAKGKKPETGDKDKKDDKDKPKTPNKDDSKSKKKPPGDMKEEYGKRVFAKRLMRGMLPLRWFISAFGHFPMSYKEDKSGCFVFKFKSCTLQGFLFIVTSFLSVYALVVGGWNFAVIVLSSEVNISKSDLTEGEAELFYETALMSRHLMIVMSMLAAIIHSVIVAFHLFKKRHYIASVYTYHSKATQRLHMDLSKGMFWNSLFIIIIYVSTLMAIILMAAFRFAPMAIGSPTLFGTFLFRLFVSRDGLWIDHSNGTRGSIQIIGGICLVIIYTASKCHMLMFIYHCKLLRNAFGAWNGRLYVSLKKAGKYVLTEDGKLTFRLLYKDHNVLTDLLEVTNGVFATIIESYYALQLATIFFEFYFFLRTAKYGDNAHEAASKGGQFFIRLNDWFPGLLLTFQSCLIALATVKIASDVGEEAKVGVDICRRKTMLGRKTDDELLFQLSLQASYNSYKRFDIGGGGYEYLNKDWIMGYINNIMGYFIILYQFQPFLDLNVKNSWKARRTLGEFYSNLEGIPRDHWTSTPEPPPVRYAEAIK